MKKYFQPIFLALTLLAAVPGALAAAASGGAELPHYLDANSMRYEEFRAENPDMPLDLVIAYVNADVDKGSYNDIQIVENPADIGVLLNKNFALPPDWVPSDLVDIDGRRQLRDEASGQFFAMKEAIREEGLDLVIRSAYRNRNSQASSYYSILNRYGLASADRNVARPGHSEHQLGLALDIVHKHGTSGALSSAGFEKSDAFAWMSGNAHKFGFILRYPKGLTDIHGYVFEPWHWRYVGIETATAMHEEGIATLEEYYGRYLAPGVMEKNAVSADSEASAGSASSAAVTSGQTCCAACSSFNALAAYLNRIVRVTIQRLPVL